jgi:hypothetical protein
MASHLVNFIVVLQNHFLLRFIEEVELHLDQSRFNLIHPAVNLAYFIKLF